jgi:hypothetical protein
MFGRRQVKQFVSLDELGRFIQQIAPQGQGGTAVTIYIQELHIHAAPQPAAPMLGAGQFPQLAAPQYGQRQPQMQTYEMPARTECDAVNAWDYPPPPQYRR